MDEQLLVSIDRPLTRFEEHILKKLGENLMPELISGSNSGTVLETDMDVAIVKKYPTRRNWYLFLTKKGFVDDGNRLINIHTNDWPIRYALARTFSGMNIAYDMRVTADMFNLDSFLCIPEAMPRKVKWRK